MPAGGAHTLRPALRSIDGGGLPRLVPPLLLDQDLGRALDADDDLAEERLEPATRTARPLSVRGAEATLERLRRRMRTRLVRGTDLGPLTILDATDAERAALDSLTGRVSRGRSLRVDLKALEATLREAGVCSDLRTAVEALDGPLEDLRALRAAEQSEWRRVFERARTRLPPEPRLGGWLDELEATGLLKRAACGDAEEAEALLESACIVLHRLPAAAVPLAELAALRYRREPR